MKRVRLVRGVGINDVDEPVFLMVNGKRVMNPYYQTWDNMLKRCYSEKVQVKQPTYKGCTVCDDWLLFSNFKLWVEQQDWEGNSLDKDLLVGGNKVYSPDTCLFIPKALNSSLLLRGNSRGEHPIGVCYHKTRKLYISNIMISGKRKHLGWFNDPQKAHREWQSSKITMLYELKASQSDSLVKIGLQRIIDKIQNEYDNKLETIDFN